MNPKRTILVTLGDEVTLFSDLAGVHTMRLDNGADSRTKFRRRLIGMKCAVNEADDAWTDPTRSGDFENCVSSKLDLSAVDVFSRVDIP